MDNGSNLTCQTWITNMLLCIINVSSRTFCNMRNGGMKDKERTLLAEDSRAKNYLLRGIRGWAFTMKFGMVPHVKALGLT